MSKKRIGLLLAGVAVVTSLITVFVMNSSKHSGKASAAVTEGVSAPVSTQTSTGGSLTPFLGTWHMFGGAVTFQSDGTFTVQYKLFRTCGSSPPPCDTSEADTSWGGSAGGHVTGATVDTIQAVITETNDPQKIGKNPVTFTLTSDKVLTVKFAPDFGGNFCNKNSPFGYCGGM